MKSILTRGIVVAGALGALAGLAGCGGQGGAEPTSTAAEPAATPDLKSPDGCVNLTVKNYLSWCDVSVAGGTASTAAEQTVCVAPGIVHVAAKPASATFELGKHPWHDTVGDKGHGDPGVDKGAFSRAKADVSATGGCVWACCPFAPNGNGCPTTDQCP